MDYFQEKTPLGPVLLAADDTGLCGLWFEGSRYAPELPQQPVKRHLPSRPPGDGWPCISPGRNRTSRRRSTSAAPPFSGPSGRCCSRSPTENRDIQRTCVTARPRLRQVAAGAAGRRRRGGTESGVPHRSLPPCGRRLREPHRLCRRPPAKGSPPPAGESRHEPPLSA